MLTWKCILTVIALIANPFPIIKIVFNFYSSCKLMDVHMFLKHDGIHLLDCV
jgi:hypothetical protein